MIKLKDILTEARSRQIRKPFFMAAATRGRFTSAVKKMLEKNNIFRGISGTASYPYWIVQPTKEYRHSRNTSNFYNGLIDGLPSWKDYPKRSRSIICSNNYIGASSFGNVLQVLPINGSKIGMCPRQDFWASFENTIGKRLGIRDMSYFNDFFVTLFKEICRVYQLPIKIINNIGDLYKDTYNEAIAELNKHITLNMAVDILKNGHLDLGYISINQGLIINDLSKNFKSDWEQYFDDLLNPEKNEFKLQTIEGYTSGMPTGKEIWTDAVCLMVSSTYRYELVKAVLGDDAQIDPEVEPSFKPNLDISI